MESVHPVTKGAGHAPARDRESLWSVGMKPMERPYGYRGGYLIGFIMIGVVTLRAILFYQGRPNFVIVMLLIAMYAVLYSLEPWLSTRFHGFKHLYFPLRTALVI